jgi:hypothetical protein
VPQVAVIDVFSVSISLMRLFLHLIILFFGKLQDRVVGGECLVGEQLDDFLHQRKLLLVIWLFELLFGKFEILTKLS